MLKRLVTSPWIGAIGCLVAIAWEGFWLVGPPVGVSDADRVPYLAWGLVAVTLCGFQAFTGLMRENRRLKAALDDRRRMREARERVGRLEEQLARYERDAYNGCNSTQYDALYQNLEQVKREVRAIATEWLDASFESRFLAVNVLDVHLDEATRMHFISRAQGSFWTMYQQIKGWRALLAEVSRELGRASAAQLQNDCSFL